MNSIIQTPYIRNEKKWYFLSVFYAKEKWRDLITWIMQYYRSRTGQFDTFLFSFSIEKGEHIQVTLVSSANDNHNYTNDIQIFFQTVVDQYPSISYTPFPYGKGIWCNYPNNTLTWNRFRLPFYTDQYIRFHQLTMRVALNLMEDDFSEETIFSVGMYLFTKVLCCIDIKEQKKTLSQILYEAAVNNSTNLDIIKKLIADMDIDEVYEAIVSYRNEDTSEYSLELINWLDEVDILLKYFRCDTLYMFICRILGLTGARQIMIIELLNKFM